jgi:hypothetical protein
MNRSDTSLVKKTGHFNLLTTADEENSTLGKRQWDQFRNEPLLGVRRPGAALVRGGLTPLPAANSVCESCDRSQPTKAVTGHRTPKRGTL